MPEDRAWVILKDFTVLYVFTGPNAKQNVLELFSELSESNPDYGSYDAEPQEWRKGQIYFPYFHNGKEVNIWAEEVNIVTDKLEISDFNSKVSKG